MEYPQPKNEFETAVLETVKSMVHWYGDSHMDDEVPEILCDAGLMLIRLGLDMWKE